MSHTRPKFKTSPGEGLEFDVWLEDSDGNAQDLTLLTITSKFGDPSDQTATHEATVTKADPVDGEILSARVNFGDLGDVEIGQRFQGNYRFTDSDGKHRSTQLFDLEIVWSPAGQEVNGG